MYVYWQNEHVGSGPFMGTYDYVALQSGLDILPHMLDDVVTHKKNSKYAAGLTRTYCR